MDAKQQHKWGRYLLATGMVCAGAGVVALTLRSPNWYVATAIVRGECVFDDEASAFYDPFFDQKESAVIQSPAVLSNVVRGLDFQSPGGRKLGFLRKLEPETACALLRANVCTRPIPNTSLTEILAAGDDPDAAADLVNAIAKAYANMPTERRRHYTREEMAMIKSGSLQVGQNTDAILTTMREDRVAYRVKAELIRLATPPTSQVTLGQRFDALRWPDYRRLPGPPAHPHRWLVRGLIALGTGLCVFALGWPRQAAVKLAVLSTWRRLAPPP